MPEPSHYWIVNVRIPDCLIDSSFREQNLDLPLIPTLQRDRLFPCHLEIRDGQIAKVIANSPDSIANSIALESLPIIDAKQGMLIPCFSDLHTHLDKGHIWERSPNLDGTFQGALKGIYRDCTEQGNWSYDDLYRRMEFGLKCSYAHGTRAIRTHLDCPPHQFETTFQVFRELREKWKEKITLQAVSLVPLSFFVTPEGEKFADAIADLGGIIGGIAHMVPEFDQFLARIMTLAIERNLCLDFHTDENNDPESRTLYRVAAAALKHDFKSQIVCGHCCSLAVQDEETANETIALVKAANVGIVSLPMCNLYLQDRVAERTPRWRGVTLVRELDAAGVNVAISSDNCRDPFYGFGDHDMLQVFTMGTKISHLDTPYGNWIESVTTRPASLMGLPTGNISVGQAADFSLFKARSYNELLSRPQSDRLVFRNGMKIDTTLPDYAELDDLINF
ncbi:cytosine deaminase [Pseudanabaena sp. FACHB-1998]|uniref:cytosine deaminase n=1 Tax=Pseudanabaena sp. FACHB-1998 TaxID=2692858 RepID=UPI001680E1FF|nr:cytosine deaminase [Pseudanabaena sp. FACHB-1998]MBD2178818.1 cytosine deaminase [Pseudanabaena sp. FACHB-1998]